MPLPADYDSPQGEADAEVAVREAIRDIFLGVAGAYGYTSAHCHTTPRYPDTIDEWNAIATIVDPDTEPEATEGERRLTRYFSVVYAGMSRVLSELTLRYDVHVSMGFKDEYQRAPAGRRSYDEIVALNMKFGKTLADNQELGLDDRCSHTFLQAPLRPRWTPEDDQGNPTVTIDNTLSVVLQVCKL